MQLLDDRSAEVLIGGCRRCKMPIRRRFAPNLTVNTAVAVVPQIAIPIAISILGGNPRATVGQSVDLGISLG